MRFLTAGESHGKGLLVIIEGIPAGLPVSEEYITRELRRRQQGYGRGPRTESIEEDEARILSGVRFGLTVGSPISIFIRNRDWENWRDVMSLEPPETPPPPVTRPRPGHADLAGALKFGFEDLRPVRERGSARETAARVAAGALAKRLLEEFRIRIRSHTLCIGGYWSKATEPVDWEEVERSPVRCADPWAEKLMMLAVDEARERGDTVGGVVEVRAEGVPPGLGSYAQWDLRLDARIARAMMSINSVKGVEIGSGFALASRFGSEVCDEIKLREGRITRISNHAGGIEGGVSNGEPVVVRLAAKPIPTLRRPVSSVDLRTSEEVEAQYERSDICRIPSIGVIAEAMLALILADAFLEKFGGDSLEEVKRNYRGYLEQIGALWRPPGS